MTHNRNILKLYAAFLLSTIFCYHTHAAVDLAATSFSVAPTPVGVNTTITFIFSNVGTTPLSNFTIGCKLNGVQGMQLTHPYTIQPGSAGSSSALSFIRPVGNFNLCLYVYSPVDANHTNDTTCSSFMSLVDSLQLPFSENFDGPITTAWSVFTPGINTTNWELGTPAYGATSGAYSGNTAYDVNLASPYMSNAQTYLITPWLNFTNKPNCKLDFYINHNSESFYDGTYVEYTLDGITWALLGTFNDINGTNWYNEQSLNGSPNGYPGWAGNSIGWKHVVLKLNSLNFNSYVKFRMAFVSDGVIEHDGASIDNFNVYQTPSTDIEVIKIISPYQNNFNINTLVPVIQVVNNGTVAAVNPPFSYRMDNGAPVSFTYNGTILPNITATIPLPSFATTVGVHNIKIYAAWTPDSLKSNDTLVKRFNGVAAQLLPVSDDFEGPNAGWFNDSQPDSLTKWQLGLPNYGQTNTAHSGNKAWDINLNNAYTNNAACYLYSPFWNIPNVPNVNLSFWLNYCANETFTLEYSPDSVNWYFIENYVFTQCVYKQYTYNLYNLGIQGLVQFRFNFSSNSGLPNGDGVSLDDINISSPPLYDFALANICAPQPVHQAFGQVPVDIKIQNLGANNGNTFIVKYEIDGVYQGQKSITSALTWSQTEIVSLPPFNTTAGVHTLKAYIDWPSDLNKSNDTLKITFNMVNAVAIGLPYINDFSTGNTFYNVQYGANTTQWQWGTPAYGATNSAHSGTTCWDVNLTSPYDAEALTYLYTPIFDFTGAVAPKLKFWLNYNTFYASDGVYVEYCTNGYSWQPLGTFNDPYGSNWYNTTLFNFANKPAWSGAAAGWGFCAYNLAPLNLNGLTQFRFAFISSVFNTYDGASIDDFEIEVALQNDAHVVGILEPGVVVTSGVPVTPQIEIRNNGSLPLTTVTIDYSVNGVFANTYTWTGNLPYDSVTKVNLPAYTPAPGLGTLKVYTSWTADLNKYNDTAQINYSSVVSYNAPYFDNFNNAQLTWIPQSNNINYTKWEYGTPNFGTTGQCFSGTQCWDINLNIAYQNVAEARLYSPFFNYNGISGSVLGIYVNYDTEYGADGMRIEYTTNGTVWNVLGTVNAPGSVNWYNSLLSDGKPGWSYYSNGFRHASIPTPFLDGKNLVRFAFVFKSDFSITGTGVTIDDFEVSQVAGIDEYNNASVSIYPNPFSGMFYVEVPQYAVGGKLYIKDVLGNTLMDQNITNAHMQIHASEWPSQIYFLQVVSGNFTTNLRVEKIK